MEDDVNVWRYAILQLHARNDDDDDIGESEAELITTIIGLHSRYCIALQTDTQHRAASLRQQSYLYSCVK